MFKKTYGDRKVTHKPSSTGYKRQFKGGARSVGAPSWKRDEDSGERPPMFPATCSQCNSSCEVPFKPNGKKPVLCLDCFRKTDAGAASASSKPREDRGNRAYPSSKPAYHSAPRAQGGDDVSRQLREMSIKMDQILAVLTVTKKSEPEE